MRKCAVLAATIAILALAACGNEPPPPVIVNVYRDRAAFAAEGMEPLLPRVQKRNMKTDSGRLIIIETADTLHLLPNPKSSGAPASFDIFLLRSEAEEREVHAKMASTQTIPWRDKTYIVGLASGLSGEKAEAAQKVLDGFIDEAKNP